MGELQIQHPFSLPPPPLPPLPPSSASRDDLAPPASRDDAPPSPPPPPFDPSRMIGIIRRKALIKELAAVYHAECLTYCQELLELQKKADEVNNPFFKYMQPLVDIKVPEEPRKETQRPTKRPKKFR